MEQRHTLSGLMRPSRMERARQVLPWIGLLVVLSTSAYGLDRAAAAFGSTAPAIPESVTGSDYSITGAQVAPMVPSVAGSDQLTSGAVTHQVLIVVDNPAGARTQLRCHVPSDAFRSNVVLVDADEFLAVAQACVDNPAAFGVRP
jgi:hypothetical protein